MKKFLNAQEVMLLNLCRDIELTGEELYFHFAEIFKDDMQAAAVWRKTALEEGNHADQFKLAAKLRIGVVESMNLDAEKVGNALKFIQSVLEGVRRSPPNLHDAFLIAIELEEKLSDFHMDCVATFTEESYRKLFAAMMNADRGHLQALQEASRQLSRSWASPVQQVEA